MTPEQAIHSLDQLRMGDIAITPNGRAALSVAIGIIRASAQEAATFTPEDAPTFDIPLSGFTCFHCGAHFSPMPAGIVAAREHFGPTPASTPLCIKQTVLVPDAMSAEKADAQAIRLLVAQSGLSHREIGERLGISKRLVRHYVASELHPGTDRENTSHRSTPYTVRFALECLAEAARVKRNAEPGRPRVTKAASRPPSQGDNHE
jgi:hypothetical protein